MKPTIVASAAAILLFIIIGSALVRHNLITVAHASEMQEACSLGDTVTIKLLLGQGEDTNAPVWEDWTPLMYAGDNAGPDAAQVLIRAGADVNIETGKGFTALNLVRGHKSAKAREVVNDRPLKRAALPLPDSGCDFRVVYITPYSKCFLGKPWAH